ncbi:MAG: outer membrane protein transport protein [Candidatus Hydrogenedentes bacterium]|nr:outer membrane protein transport protein [Candidatus Hydrogenedentota bacterium]
MRSLKRACRLSPCSLAAALVLVAHAAVAQINVNSSPNVVGSGARALGMGGAFIAVADDATSASWNPGGLTQLERPELSIVYSWKWASEDFESKYHPELGGNFDVNFDDLNYLSVVYPIPWTLAGRNFVLSLNYQRKYDFTRALDVDFRDNTALSLGNTFDRYVKVHYRQDGGLSTLSPAFGFEVTDNLSLGVVANIWDESLVPGNEWKERDAFWTRSRINGGIPSIVWGEIVDDYKGIEGLNYTFGALYKATERLSFGAVYNSKFTADVNHTQYFRLRGGTPAFQSAYKKEKLHIEFPTAAGLGVAYRFPNDKLTLSLDITRRAWDGFVKVDRAGRRTSGVTGQAEFLSKVDPTYTVRFGAEYVFIDAKKPLQEYLPSLRFGLLYDPEPSGGRRDRWFGLDKGNGEPDNYYGITLGTGVLIKNRVNLDAAYQYRWGNGGRKDTFGLPGTTADVGQHQFNVSTVIYF